MYERTRSLGGQKYDPQSHADSEMVSENMHDHANLPKEVIMRDYPMSEYADFPYLDDTIRAIDERGRENKKIMNKGMGKNIRY